MLVVSSHEDKALKLINGSFRTWSCMGMDFAQPIDLRGKNIVFVLRGKDGGEKFEITFRDKHSQGTTPQLEIIREEGLDSQWKEIVIKPEKHDSTIDLSSITRFWDHYHLIR